MAIKKTYVENKDGVHLYSPFFDFTLCGDTDDGDTHPAIESDPLKNTKKRIVTCKRCIAIIRICQGVKWR